MKYGEKEKERKRAIERERERRERENDTMVTKSASNVKSRIHEYMLYTHDKSNQMIYVSKGTDYLTVIIECYLLTNTYR